MARDRGRDKGWSLIPSQKKKQQKQKQSTKNKKQGLHIKAQGIQFFISTFMYPSNNTFWLYLVGWIQHEIR